VNLITKAYLLQHLLRWRLRWDRRDTHTRFAVPGNPKFMSAREAVQLVQDGDIIATSGIAGNQRMAVLLWAIREVFDESGHPRNITLLCTSSQGGRGRVPGSMEDLGVEGLCTRLITAHVETVKALLKMAEAGKLEIQCLPQGVLAFLIESQADGEESVLTGTGIGTFMDPRVGPGSHIFDPKAEQLVSVEGDLLRYRTPKIRVAMFGAPAADREGNLYLDNAAIIGDTFDIVRAARKNAGRVIANVGCVVKEGAGKVVIPARDVDAIVLDPDCEQTFTVRHRKYWSLFTTHSDLPVREAISRLRFINRVLGLTPRRMPIDEAVARLAAQTFAQNARRGMNVNVGVGLPEEACRMLFEAGLLQDLTVFTESGVIGGLPAPGVFFGAAACPKQMVRSAEAFALCQSQLDVAMLGALEVDSGGDVNASKRAEGAINYVGPGGFIDISTGARMIIFVTSWMAHADIRIEDGRIRIVKHGALKFVDNVSEITFSGEQALKAGKGVFYVTTVGVFQLTERGVELIRVMPGIDVKTEIIAASSMRIVLPPSGHVPVVDASVVTGASFSLAFPE
jgi:propionate CoA-transferase